MSKKMEMTLVLEVLYLKFLTILEEQTDLSRKKLNAKEIRLWRPSNQSTCTSITKSKKLTSLSDNKSSKLRNLLNQESYKPKSKWKVFKRASTEASWPKNNKSKTTSMICGPKWWENSTISAKRWEMTWVPTKKNWMTSTPKFKHSEPPWKRALTMWKLVYTINLTRLIVPLVRWTKMSKVLTKVS